MKFLQNPSLPAARVRLCALGGGEAYIDAVRLALKALGVEALPVEPHPALPGPVQRHADLQLHHLGGSEVVVAPGADRLASALAAYHFSVITASLPLGSRYPLDIPLCCFSLGDTLYAKLGHTAPEILARYPKRRDIAQGYARCSTCLVGKDAIITADPGIAAAAERDGLDVLRIRPGHIRLPGYGYGFIGGCAGLLSPNTLAFTGKLSTHPQGERIAAFCRGQGVDTLEIAGGELTDIGGIIPLLEEA